MNETTALSTQQDFNGTSRQLAVVETASTAIAAQAKAMVESRYIMAMRNPRNMDAVRQELLKECRRPSTEYLIFTSATVAKALYPTRNKQLNN